MSRIRVRNQSTGEVGTIVPGDASSFEADTPIPSPQAKPQGKTGIFGDIGGALKPSPFDVIPGFQQGRLVKSGVDIFRKLPPFTYSTIGGIGGGMVGGLPGATLGASIGQAMASPEDKPMEVAKTAGLTYGGGKLLEIPGRIFGKPILTGKGQTEFSEKTANIFRGARGRLGRTFGKQFDNLVSQNPDTIVDYSQPIQQIKELENFSPGVVGRIKSSLKNVAGEVTPDFLDAYVEDPSLASNLTVRQAQNLKQAINRLPELAKVFGRKRTSPLGGQLSEISLSMREAETKALPELKPIFQKFSKGMENVRRVGSMTDVLGAESKIFEGGKFSPVQKQAAKDLLEGVPKGGKAFKKMMQARRTANVGRVAKNPFLLLRAGSRF